MSAAERAHERALADLYENVRPVVVKGPRWPRFKAWVEAFGTGYALGQVIRKLTR